MHIRASGPRAPTHSGTGIYALKKAGAGSGEGAPTLRLFVKKTMDLILGFGAGEGITLLHQADQFLRLTFDF